MDKVLNAIKAPFDHSAAALTTPTHVAVVWTLIGVAGVTLLKKA